MTTDSGNGPPHRFLCLGGNKFRPPPAAAVQQDDILRAPSSSSVDVRVSEPVPDVLWQILSALSPRSQHLDVSPSLNDVAQPTRRNQRKPTKNVSFASGEAKRPCHPSTSSLDSSGLGNEVGFRWLKTGNLIIENVDVKNGDGQSSQSQTMVCIEATPKRPSRKGWQTVKAVMDHVLGRSIVPSLNHKLSGAMYPSTGRILRRRTSGAPAATETKSVKLEVSTRDPFSGTQPAEVLDKPKASKENQKSVPFSQHNAVAGAMAGTCVSLCLHPVDTVKTVIQAQYSGHRSLARTILSIISDRGFLGLYRGLASNLASSAPISAIYTFTYETVKAALLPHLPKEYHAIAHCAAGGCASIATSVVYTPSECVKQRMQVGSLYRNSWIAFWSILSNGGLPVLYSGWWAVLCRNVPQSIIKFYTYECLKHCALTGRPDDAPLHTWHTLAFGGIAGSTAALFTTPFDVIKTRLQTQLPGKVLHHKGVFQAFQHIAKTEGVCGLYRGLIPRLVIYMSQGALFFTSYEIFKQLLAIELNKMRSSTSKMIPLEDKLIESV